MNRRQFLKRASLGTLGLIASYPVFIERYLILENTYRIPVPFLPEAFSGFRIVHLTDLHYGFLVPLGIIKYVVNRANKLKPDAIVCTGDYVHERNSSSQIDQVWPVLSGLSAPSGVYSVLGNHDHWANTERSKFWLKKSGQDLQHKGVRLQRSGQTIWFAGTGDFWEDRANLDNLLGSIPDQECRIVLAHNPDTADIPRRSRVDLMLSGHTHGGQVNLPLIGAPVLPVKNKNYTSGLKQSVNGSPVFICRGIGWTIYPVRFNCYPEIAVLELVSGAEKKS